MGFVEVGAASSLCGGMYIVLCVERLWGGQV